MKVKNHFMLFVFTFLWLGTHAQLVNVNPDPNGDPWIVGVIPEITPEVQAKIDAIPEMTLSDISSTIQLPDMVDNSQNIYMRPIFSQWGGSCSQAAGVGYAFTYEVNWKRNLPSSEEANQYPTHYTWNFLNDGSMIITKEPISVVLVVL